MESLMSAHIRSQKWRAKRWGSPGRGGEERHSDVTGRFQVEGRGVGIERERETSPRSDRRGARDREGYFE